MYVADRVRAYLDHAEREGQVAREYLIDATAARATGDLGMAALMEHRMHEAILDAVRATVVAAVLLAS